jgi:hypothetical protein
MTPIFAVTPFPPLVEQLLKDSLDGFPVPSIRFVKRHHVHENDMSFVHEEVAE